MYYDPSSRAISATPAVSRGALLSWLSSEYSPSAVGRWTPTWTGASKAAVVIIKLRSTRLMCLGKCAGGGINTPLATEAIPWFAVTAAPKDHGIVSVGCAIEDLGPFWKGFSGGFTPNPNAWFPAKPKLYIRQVLWPVQGTVYEVSAGLSEAILVGTFVSKDDAVKCMDQYNVLCNGKYDTNRVLNLDEYVDVGTGSMIIDSAIATTFYDGKHDESSATWPLCMHMDEGTKQAYAVRNVVGDGRCLFRALAWHGWGDEAMHTHVSNVVREREREKFTTSIQPTRLMRTESC